MLASLRASRYAYTRPGFAMLGAWSAYAADASLRDDRRARAAVAESTSVSSSSRSTRGGDDDGGAPSSSSSDDDDDDGAWIAAVAPLAALPLLVVGATGVAAVVSRRGGLAWLSHGYEHLAWGLTYSSLIASATASLSSITAAARGPSSLVQEEQATAGSTLSLAHALLTPGAGAALAAIAGERLGSAVGPPLLLTLAGAGATAAAVATGMMPRSALEQLQSLLPPPYAVASPEGAARVCYGIQASALVVMPALTLWTLPVYTHSTTQVALGIAWLWLAAGGPGLFGGEPGDRGAAHEPLRQLVLAVGAFSILRTLIVRAPICQF